MFEVFGRRNCPYCIKAEALLTERNAMYVFYDLNTNDGVNKYQSGYRTMVPSYHNTVPVIFKDKRFIGGYTELATMFL
jgi:glutaredoxin